jgi:hypothetical protein
VIISECSIKIESENMLLGGKPIPQDRVRNLLEKPEAVQPIEEHAGETALARTVQIDVQSIETPTQPIEVQIKDSTHERKAG